MTATLDKPASSSPVSSLPESALSAPPVALWPSQRREAAQNERQVAKQANSEASLTVEITAADIRDGKRTVFGTHPLLCAIARAMGSEQFDLVWDEDGSRSVVARQGRGTVTLRLPARCQYFLRVWDYGPCGTDRDFKQWAVRDKAGNLLSLRSWNEIICPFTFTLEAGA